MASPGSVTPCNSHRQAGVPDAAQRRGQNSFRRLDREDSTGDIFSPAGCPLSGRFGE
jgi:hypothetical protein